MAATACKGKRNVIIFSCVGAVIGILGAVFIPVAQYYIRQEVQKNLVLKEDGKLYPMWRDLPIPIYTQFYLFSCTNPDEVMLGGKPNVTQVGPYTYREYRTKTNITFHDNGTVSYIDKAEFVFNESMSVGGENDSVTTVNTLLVGLVESLQWESEIVRVMTDMILEASYETLFLNRTIYETLWGYDDALLTQANKMAPKWFYTNVVGYLAGWNNSADGLFNIYTGANDISKLGQITKYNGSEYLPFWSTKYANMINGTDGSFGPSYLERSAKIYFFSPNICRSAPAKYLQDGYTKQNIHVYIFSTSAETFEDVKKNPDNRGFCTPETNCMKAGLLNISACRVVDQFHIPGVVSFPHFYMADPSVVDAVIGMHPNKKEHQTTIGIEPYSGLVIEADLRIQLNVYIKPIDNITQTLNITPIVFPLFWLNQSASLDDANADMLKELMLTPILLTQIIEFTLIGIGGVIFVLSLVYAIYSRNENEDQTKRKERNVNTAPETLLSGDI